MFFSAADQEHLNFSNPVYDVRSPTPQSSPRMDADKVKDLLQDHLRKRELVVGNLDPNSVKKRNDVKVCARASTADSYPVTFRRRRRGNAEDFGNEMRGAQRVMGRTNSI